MGTKNTMGDLNNILFEELERLNDTDLKGEELEKEMERAKAINEVSKQVIANAKTVLAAAKFRDDHLNADMSVPRMLTGGDE